MISDSDGNRVSSTINGVTTSYIGNYFEWTGSTSTMVKYYFEGSARLAERQGTGAAQYFLDDHLSSTSITVDTNGNLTAELRYKAWGETRYTNGSTPTSYKYTGQKQEATLGGTDGLYFYNSRWYDPYLSRWIQPDSIIPDPNGPQSYDRYAYAQNNPVRYNDPTGHNIWDTVGQFATGFVAEIDRSFFGVTPQVQALYGPSSNESNAMLTGRLAADVVQIVSGIAAIDTGAGGILVGASACATGVGCPGGVVVAAGGVAAVGVGSVAVVEGAIGLGENLSLLKGNATSSKNAPNIFKFSDPELLTEHFNEHGAELGYRTADEYENGANNLFNREGVKTFYRESDGATLYYDKATNEYGVLNQDGTIGTYFSPDAGYAYWLKQIGK